MPGLLGPPRTEDGHTANHGLLKVAGFHLPTPGRFCLPDDKRAASSTAASTSRPARSIAQTVF
jgi:hypothetical protein